MDYKKYYENQIGSGLVVFRGSKQQKGMGLGSVFKSFFKWAVPLFKTHALPAITASMQSLGSEAIKTATNVANDALSGKSIEEATKDRTKEAINELGSQIQKKIQSGSGLKRSSSPTISLISVNCKRKRRRIKDIFDH